jgi:predicted GIY-YIG superfamily endonuclease
VNDRISIGQAGLNGRRHALYRFFDQSDVLLYVGITVDIGARFKKHRSDKPWWDQVDHIGIEHFDTRREAEAAEREAIQREQPLHNVVHNLFVAPAPAEEDSDSSLACDIVYGYLDIDHGSEQHRDLIKRAKERAEDDEREFGDPDVEVARLLVVELIDQEWAVKYRLKTLLSALPKNDLEHHRSQASETCISHGIADPDSDDVECEVIRRLTGELAWSYLNRLDLEARRYFVDLALGLGLDACSVPVHAIKYYQHHLDGDLQQVLESEGRS